MPHVGKHAPVLLRDLLGIAHDPQIFERAALSLPFRIGRRQIHHQAVGHAGLVGQLALQHLSAARQVARDGQARLHGGKQLGLFLHHLRESLLHQAVQDFIDLLARHMRASRQFDGLEARMPDQNQVRSRLIGVQAQLLQPAPEALKIQLGQFGGHRNSKAKSRAYQKAARVCLPFMVL